MKKSVWIFLFAVLLPSAVLGWLALRSAGEQQIIFERRTAELYQKETEAMAVTVRDAIDAERRVFGDTVHRLLARGDADALAHDFTNTLADAWGRKAIGFALDKEGKLISPALTASAKNPEWRRFLMGNSSFLSSSEPATVYAVQADNNFRGASSFPRSKAVAIVSQVARNEELPSRPDGKDAAEMSSEAKGLSQDKPGDFSQLESRELLDRKSASNGRAPAKGDKLAPFVQTAAPEPLLPTAEKVGDAPKSGAKPSQPSAPTMATAGMPKPDASKQDDRRAASPTGGSSPRPVAPAIAPPATVAKKEMAGGRYDSGLAVAEEREAGMAESPKSRSMPAPVIAKPKEQEVLQMRNQQKESADEVFADQSSKFAMNRQVEPQQLLGAPTNAISMLTPATAEFRTLTEESDEGIVSRFVQNKLDLIFWVRPPEAPEMVFGCLVEAADFSELWDGVLERHTASSRDSYDGSGGQPRFVLALLDDRGHPAATRPRDAGAHDWKRPFVASEIGEMLPHWEAALYLASPTALADSARGLWRTLAFTIAGAVALIALGGWLVVADARRQLALAQQKTDFVSNVSHELKTPLTSIRMFAELMHDRPQPKEKQSQYLRIITVEAERLTRLINNVLDFAKIGRQQKRFEKKPVDLHEVVSRVWESQGLHLREAGFASRWDAAPGPYPVLGDEDALSQVLVNLLSNAEKYSTDRKEVELHTWIDDGWVNTSVLDRGMGVPDGEERKIFEAFYRAHDSLSSGIQGSGLGLTLAQRVAKEHGGEIKFESREGGGSQFTLRLPLNP